MHELAVTQHVFNIVLRHAESNGAKKVIGVNLRIGELRDIVDDWMQKFFDHLSRGTIVEGAKLNIERLPIVFRCECGESFPVNFKEFLGGGKGEEGITCPHCGGAKAALFSGKEFEIQGIEVI